MVNQWWGTGLKARVSGHPAPSFLKKVIGREVGRGEHRCVSLPWLSQMWSTRAWPSRCAWAIPDVIQGFKERGYESTWEPVNGYPVSQINVRLVPGINSFLMCDHRQVSGHQQVERLMFVPGQPQPIMTLYPSWKNHAETDQHHECGAKRQQFCCTLRMENAGKLM